MPAQKVTPILLLSPPGDLCRRRYPNHPRGCPNYGKKDTCPPRAERWTQQYIIDRTWYAVWNKFDFGAHVDKMWKRHPEWSKRQLACCLYWQGTARKQLERGIHEFLYSLVPATREKAEVHRIPEAHGVNVTTTMDWAGVTLEWPPEQVTYQIALVSWREQR